MGFLLIGLPVLVFVGLLSAPAGRPALKAFAAAGALWAVAVLGVVISPPQPTGPDDWYSGIGEVSVVAVFVMMLPAGAAQFLRWRRLAAGHASHYGWLIAGAVAVLTLALILLFETGF